MSAARAVVVPDRGLLADVGAVARRCVLWDDVESAAVAAEDIAFAVIDGRGGAPRRELLQRLPNLEVVQALSVGVDFLEGWCPAEATLCNAAPAISEQTAEHALALVLALLRRIPEYAGLQSQGVWAGLKGGEPAVPRAALGSLWGSDAAVLGFGTIGASVAQRLRAFRANVTGYARTAREVDGFPVLPLREVGTTIRAASVVVSALPLTDETEGMLDEAFFASLASGAVFVNVGRGRTVVQEALIDAAASGHVRAGLDVVDPEPLPPSHPLFTTPGVLLTPHVAGDNDHIVETLGSFVADQVRAWERGLELAAAIRVPSAQPATAEAVR